MEKFDKFAVLKNQKRKIKNNIFIAIDKFAFILVRFFDKFRRNNHKGRSRPAIKHFRYLALKRRFDIVFIS